MWSRDAIFILHFDLSRGAVLHEEARGKSCNVIWKSAAQLFLVQTPVWLSMVLSGHVKNQLTLIHNCKVLRPRGPENSHFICFFLFSTIATSYKCALQEAVWLQFGTRILFLHDLATDAIISIVFVNVFQATEKRAFYSHASCFYWPCKFNNMPHWSMSICSVGKWGCWKALVWDDAEWWEKWSASFHPVKRSQWWKYLVSLGPPLHCSTQTPLQRTYGILRIHLVISVRSQTEIAKQ